MRLCLENYKGFYVQKYKYGTNTLQVKIKGEGKPVIIVHGIMNSSNSWKRVATYLSHNYRVYIVDIPGFGGTKYNHTDDCSYIESYSQILSKFINEVSTDGVYGIVCHSMGGMIVNNIMKKGYITEPEHIIYCSVPFNGIAWLKPFNFLEKPIYYGFKLGGKLNNDLIYRICARIAFSKYSFITEEILGEIKSADFDVAAKLIYEIIHYSHNIFTDYSKTKVTFIQGKYDLYANRITHRDIKKVKGHRNYIFKKSQHMPMIEEEKLFMKKLEYFLAN